MTAQIRMIATALILCFHFIVVSTSPAPPKSANRPEKHAKWMWARQVRHKLPSQAQSDSWPGNRNRSQEMKTNHASYHLPPVSEVFKMVALIDSRQSAKESRQSVKPAMTQDHISPTVIPQVLVVPSSPALSSAPKAVTALVPTTTIAQTSSLVSNRGPDFVIPSQTATPEAPFSDSKFPERTAVITESFAPTGSSFLSEDSRTYTSDITGVSRPQASGTVSGLDPMESRTVSGVDPMESRTVSGMGPMETGTILDAVQPTSPDTTPHATASRLVMIGALIASLIALMFLVYFILNYRLFALCRRKKEEGADSWTKIASPPPPGTYHGAEKEIVYETPGSQRSASSVYSTHDSERSASDSNARLDSTIPTGVIDISSNYPRSKFSICSSEYPASVCSQYSTSSVHSPLDGEQVNPSTPLPAYQFYCQPPEPSEDTRHSRTHSEPVFYPDAHGGTPQLLIRAIQHRKSRSISGLTYTVKTEQRESGSSAGDWLGSPQSPSGWPSAL